MKESLRAFIVEKWVPALRSGEYTQGRGALFSSLGETGEGIAKYAYCCLGVACDFTCEKLENGFYYPGDTVSRNATLPGQLAREFGITPDGGFYQIRGTMDVLGVYNIHKVPPTLANISLVHLNDDALWTFGQIADLLENMASDDPSYEFYSQGASR